MLHLTFSMAPNIIFAPNICRTQNTDIGRKTQTQLISALGPLSTHNPIFFIFMQFSGEFGRIIPFRVGSSLCKILDSPLKASALIAQTPFANF